MRVRVDLVPGPAPGLAPASPARATPRWTGVAIDVLRATTTLSVALAAGAKRVVPLASVEEALALRARSPEVLACGEREGRIVPGFDLGNSPFEYDAAHVAGRTLAFASTNGSHAMLAIAGCGLRLLAAFVNASAVLEALADRPLVRIMCAGKLEGFALEDAACAGWLCGRLAARGAVLEGPAARLVARLAPRDAAEVRSLVQGSSHGRELRDLGPEYARDVEFCATLDSLDRAASI